ncbi:MAG: hypothetical protein NWQ28_08065 [Nodularia sp. (in: cyanobacteria)]|nr:hypothetical protein [Nodularia sp. (in: cyanobacteria)]
MVTDTSSNKTKRKHKKDPLKNKLDKLLDKFRWSIQEQIAEFKANELAKYSDGFYRDALTGYRIKDFSKVQVDHNADVGKSFRQLAYNFLSLHKIDIAQLRMDKLGKLMRDFAAYHRENCSLRIVSTSRNRWLFYKHHKRNINWKEFYNFVESNVQE